MNTINDCCKDKNNLELKSEREATNMRDASRPGKLFMRICKVCSRRHFTLKAETGYIGAGIGNN